MSECWSEPCLSPSLCVHVASRRKTIKAKPASTSTALMEALKYLARTAHKPCRCHNNITTAPTHPHAHTHVFMFAGKKESPLRTFHNKSREQIRVTSNDAAATLPTSTSFIYTKLVYDALKQKAHSRNAHKQTHVHGHTIITRTLTHS